MKACWSFDGFALVPSPSSVVTAAFDRLDRQHAGAHRLAVDMDGAGAALREAAAELRSFEREIVAQHVEQRRDDTLLFALSQLVINPHLRKYNYHPLESFEPICQLAVAPTVMSVNGTSTYRSLKDLLDAARAKPGSVIMASIGLRGSVDGCGFPGFGPAGRHRVSSWAARNRSTSFRPSASGCRVR